MPNTNSAKKYLKQSTKRRAHNRTMRATLRTRLKKFRALLDAGPSQQEADAAFSQVVKALDQAASKDLLHANTAARTKSRLAAQKRKALTSS